MDLTKMGERLKAARKEKGYSLRSVGEILDIDYSYLGKVENGKVKNPSLANIERLCKLYGISEASLFGSETKIQEINDEDLEWISIAKEYKVSPNDMKKYIDIVKKLKDMS